MAREVGPKKQTPGRVELPPLLLPTEASGPGLDSSDQGAWSSTEPARGQVEAQALWDKCPSGQQ